MQQNRASKKQQELLSFVDGFIKGNGYGPSYREIMRALGYKSVSTVAIHIDNLIAKGYLARRDNSARSLEVVTMRGADSESPAATPKPDINAELTQRIEQADLNAQQQELVAQALDLLGLSLPAAAARTKGSDE
jgi:SOS-response transcriptional repressor LexA